jgi:hypothetical protein
MQASIQSSHGLIVDQTSRHYSKPIGINPLVAGESLHESCPNIYVKPFGSMDRYRTYCREKKEGNKKGCDFPERIEPTREAI